jgi:hypothetical protein
VVVPGILNFPDASCWGCSCLANESWYTDWWADVLIVLGSAIPGSIDEDRDLLSPDVRAWLILSMTAGFLIVSREGALEAVADALRLASALCWVETEAADPLTGLIGASEPPSALSPSSRRDREGRGSFRSELSKEFIVPTMFVVGASDVLLALLIREGPGASSTRVVTPREASLSLKALTVMGASEGLTTVDATALAILGKFWPLEEADFGGGIVTTDEAFED